MLHHIKVAGIFIFLMSLYLLVNAMDYQDASVEFDRYCRDVKDGIHPDYNLTYEYCEDQQ